jgi:hypothetical protein
MTASRLFDVGERVHCQRPDQTWFTGFLAARNPRDGADWAVAVDQHGTAYEPNQFGVLVEANEDELTPLARPLGRVERVGLPVAIAALTALAIVGLIVEGWLPIGLAGLGGAAVLGIRVLARTHPGRT